MKANVYSFTLIIGVLVLLFSIHSVADPAFFDHHGNLISASRTICGEDNLLPMTSQSEELKEFGRPVGILDIKMLGWDSSCTGTLIDKDLFLTARHCAAACEDLSVRFGFLEEDPDTDGIRTSLKFNCSEIVEKGGFNLNEDYMVIRLEGNPGIEWGWYKLDDTELKPGQTLMMVHHPAGMPMQMSVEECQVVEIKEGMLHHRCDTMGGSSGTGILVPNYEAPQESRVVAVHTMGGCYGDEEDTSNSGPAMSHLTSISELLDSYAISSMR